jgi:ribonuclease-3
VHTDAKQEIARLVVAKGVKVEYRMERNMEIERGTGKQKFWIGCYLTGWGHQDKWLGSGEGQNKVQAGALAAADALVRSKEVLEDAHRKKLEAYPKPKEE